MRYQVQENCLTIYLPREVDHHNADEIRKEADAVIVVAGNSAAEEGEYVYADMEELYVKSMGGDRTQGIALPAHDREILSACGRKTT